MWKEYKSALVQGYAKPKNKEFRMSVSNLMLFQVTESNVKTYLWTTIYLYPVTVVW